MIRKTLEDNDAGHANGWNPDGSLTTFFITTHEDLPLDSSMISIMTKGTSTVNEAICVAINHQDANGVFWVKCSTAPPEDAQLHYQITRLPSNVVESSSSSSTLFTSGSTDRQDETSSEFP